MRKTIWTEQGAIEPTRAIDSPTLSLYPQRGAIGRVVGGRFRIVLPTGFLARWHKAALPLDTEGPTEVARRLNLFAITNQLRSGTDQQRVEAAEALRSLGRQSVKAIGNLLESLLEDPLPSVRWRVLDTLRRIGPGPSTTQAVVAALRDDLCRSIRWRAAEALGQGTVRSTIKIQSLIAACGDPDPWVRWHAQRVLLTSPPPVLLLPHLINNLSSNSRPSTRAFVLKFLSRYPDLKPSRRRQIIARGLRDPYTEVREAAVELLTLYPDLSPRILAMLQQCLHSCCASVRAKAIRALESLGLPYRSAEQNLRSALRDPEPDVRCAAIEALVRSRGSLTNRKRLMNRGLRDSDVSVRESAAVGLCKLGDSRRILLRSLVNDLGNGNNSLRAWRCIVELTRKTNNDSTALLTEISPSILRWCIAEDVAEGVLPTVGLRLWPNKARIRFPNKEGGDLPPRGIGYPWVNAGVCHSWEAHDATFQRPTRDIVTQACFHSEPFPSIHLIAASQFMLFLPARLDARVAPVHIEGRPVAFVIQGGGNVAVLPGMKSFGPVDTYARTDFIYATNLRWVQYAVYAALSDRLPPAARSPLEVQAADLWLKYVERVTELLYGYRLKQFVDEEWFDETGWESSRYGIRWERRYDELRPGMVRLFQAIRSTRGSRLRRFNREITGDLMCSVELALWNNRLREYPASLLAALESGIAGERVANFASAVKEDIISAP